MDKAKTAARRDEKHLIFGGFRAVYIRGLTLDTTELANEGDVWVVHYNAS